VTTAIRETRTPETGHLASEMTASPRFARRVRRLVAVSSIMLGLITLLAALSPQSKPLALGLLVAGWILMPTTLDMSVQRPRLRYGLSVPAALVAAGLISVATSSPGWSMATVGWWLLTVGVLFGGTLGMWFWYRWMPVPHDLDNPFSVRRGTLIVVHVGLILVGIVLIILG